jgi:hypothetical protein
MTELLFQITERHEYILLIDAVTLTPPTGVLALEKLKTIPTSSVQLEELQ